MKYKFNFNLVLFFQKITFLLIDKDEESQDRVSLYLQGSSCLCALSKIRRISVCTIGPRRLYIADEQYERLIQTSVNRVNAKHFTTGARPDFHMIKTQKKPGFLFNIPKSEMKTYQVDHFSEKTRREIKKS